MRATLIQWRKVAVWCSG